MRCATRTGALVAAAWIGLACGASNDATPDVAANAPLLVEAAAVRESARYEVAESFAGRVAARRASDLGFDRSGRVIALHVDEGDAVAAGDLLAELEARELRAELRELRARRVAIEARLELAKRTTERRSRLSRSDSISQQAYDEARFAEDALVAELEAARAGITRVEIGLELSELRAPFAGRVVSRSIDEGTVATPGQPILRVLEDGPVELRVGLPTSAADALDAERSYEVEIAGRTHPARLHARIPTVDPRTRTASVIFRLDAGEQALREGALGRLTLTSERPGPGFWLPLTALTEGRRGLWSAYAITPAEAGSEAASDLWRVERRDVQVVHVDTERAFVRGTLRDGERIVTTGLHRIVPGQRVRARIGGI